MLTGLWLGALIALRGFPETASARWLDRQIGEVRRSLARLERRHLVFAILLSIVLIAGAELLAVAGPLDLGLIMLWDVSTYLDIVLATTALASVCRGRTVVKMVVVRLARVRPRRRTPRAHAVRRAERPANDDAAGPRALAA